MSRLKFAISAAIKIKNVDVKKENIYLNQPLVVDAAATAKIII